MKRSLPKGVPGGDLSSSSSSSAWVSNPSNPNTNDKNLQNSAHVAAITEIKRLREAEASVLRDLEEGTKALDNTKNLIKACNRKVEGLESKVETLTSSLKALYEALKQENEEPITQRIVKYCKRVT